MSAATGGVGGSFGGGHEAGPDAHTISTRRECRGDSRGPEPMPPAASTRDLDGLEHSPRTSSPGAALEEERRIEREAERLVALEARRQGSRPAALRRRREAVDRRR